MITAERRRDIQCIMDNRYVMTCTWNQQHNPNEYTLFYQDGSRQRSVTPCPPYLVVDHYISCKINVSNRFTQPFTVKLNRSSHESPVVKHYEKRPIDYLKMEPPFNLTVEDTNKGELLLKWQQELGKVPNFCLTYRVRYRNMVSDWTEKEATATLFSLPSFDRCQNYTFYASSKMSSICSNTLMWSEWSDGVTWARNATNCDDQPSPNQPSKFMQIGFTVGLTLLLVVIFIAVIGQERIWVILVPQIPNPGKKFETLFTTYGNDFQEWVGVSKEAVERMKPNYSEPFCVVTEDPDSTGQEGKTLTPISPAN
ncbi:cytokine receptor common subunit gamma isoform X2 [Hyperolius riggenbachi]|uniref:cytokine receptor common subunit gamma isoform X2 n=1 Tax=Hyperolius riggenbachi TaxID=752182 RepID=UPI0035A309CC